MYKILIGVAVVAIGLSAYYLTGKNDSVVEQIAEEVLEQQLGIDIDLSPND